MTSVCTTYILIAPEGLKLSTAIAYPAGILATLIAFLLFIRAGQRMAKQP